MNIAKALSRNTRKLLHLPNVVAVGRGLKVTGGRTQAAMSIICSVTKKIPEGEGGLAPSAVVPKEVNGVPTDVIETGEFRALRTGRHRPAPGGVSLGHVLVSAGTLGPLVIKGGDTFILSNNHVLANSNSASKGDDIVQPGKADGGVTPTDVIAELWQFEPIVFDGEVPSTPCPIANGLAIVANIVARGLGSKWRLASIRESLNLVDAAIARPRHVDDVSSNILEVGVPKGSASAVLGTGLIKSGRTSGVTYGEVLQVDVTVRVNYGEGKVATFTDQLMAGEMSQPGDSGSVVLNNSREVVGLLFAGSDNSTIINRIEHVLDIFGVEIAIET